MGMLIPTRMMAMMIETIMIMVVMGIMTLMGIVIMMGVMMTSMMVVTMIVIVLGMIMIFVVMKNDDSYDKSTYFLPSVIFMAPLISALLDNISASLSQFFYHPIASSHSPLLNYLLLNKCRSLSPQGSIQAYLLSSLFIPPC